MRDLPPSAPDPPPPARFRHQGVMGTVIDVAVRGGSDPEATDRWMIDEMRRLERVFSVYDHESELCRWRSGALVTPSAELGALLVHAQEWMTRSGGVFNPRVGVLVRRWRDAEGTGVAPTDDELAALADTIASPAFEVRDGVPTVVGDADLLDLNAIAKGFIVDRVLAGAIERFDPDLVVLGAGGDVAVRGRESAPVGVENPLRPYDNEPPLTVVGLRDESISTSGGSRRGFVVAGRRLSHLIDPRTGHPATTSASVSVVAPDAMTSDVVATAAAVLEPDAALAWLAALDDVVALLVDPTGDVRPGPGWVARFGPVRPGSTR